MEMFKLYDIFDVIYIIHDDVTLISIEYKW